MFLFVFVGIKCIYFLKYCKGKFLNGNILFFDLEFFKGVILVFECNEGYEFKGSDIMICMEFGWIFCRLLYCCGKCLFFEFDK